MKRPARHHQPAPAVPAPRRSSAFGLPVCRHCGQCLQLLPALEVVRLVQLHQPGLEQLRPIDPAEHLAWCPLCLSPGCPA